MRPQSPKVAIGSGTVIYDDDSGPGRLAGNDEACRILSPEVVRVASIVGNGDGISYPGGKGNLYQKLINLIPPHRVYIEAFAGGGAVLRNKRSAGCSIAIDIDTAALETLRSTIATDDGNTWLFLNLDAIEWLKTYDFQGEEFIYCDPPYVMSSRRQHRRLYRYELSELDHDRLLKVLVEVPCKVMISGYWSELYDNYLSTWSIATFDAMTRGGSWAKEYVWMNYPIPIELHDYSFLGENFRERERIKRKKQRWVNRLKSMPILERQALLSAIAETGDMAGQEKGG